jgi:hydroxypyruvate isomerase
MTQQQPLSPTADGSWFLSPCIEWIFKEEHADICDRVRAAAAAGLPGVEFHMWRNKPLDDLKHAADDSGIIITSFLVEPRCSLVTLEGREALVTAVTESADAGHRMGARALVVASGMIIPEVSRRQQRDALVSNLRWVAPIVEERGLTLLLEPVNTLRITPAHFDSNAEGLDVVEEGHPAVACC